LGCFLLIVGVFAMLYVRERRVWVWLTPVPGQSGSQATMALSSNRKTMESDQEFELLKTQLLKVNA
jgi:cytochrome c biogenesis protein